MGHRIEIKTKVGEWKHVESFVDEDKARNHLISLRQRNPAREYRLIIEK